MRRFLTHGTDKVVAIVGIAFVLSKGEGWGHSSVPSHSTYLAGMWNRRLSIEYELLWTVGPQPDRQPARKALHGVPSAIVVVDFG